MPYQTNEPTLHLAYCTTTNTNCTTFICTKEHRKVILTAYCLQSADSQHSHCCCCHTNTLTAVHYTILTAYCLQSADSQHSHCCCCPTNTLTAVHYTNSTTFVSPSAQFQLFVLLLCWTLRYQQNSLQITGCLSQSCFGDCKGRRNTHCGTQWRYFFPAVTHCYWFTSKSINQNSRYLKSHCLLTISTSYDLY